MPSGAAAMLFVVVAASNEAFPRALDELFRGDELYTAWSSGRLNLSALGRELNGVGLALLRDAHRGRRLPTPRLMEECARLGRVGPDYFREYRALRRAA
jgi:hypothetical protein